MNRREKRRRAGLGAVQGQKPTPPPSVPAPQRPAASVGSGGRPPRGPALAHAHPAGLARGPPAPRRASPGAGCRCPVRWPRWLASWRTAAASPRCPRPQRPWRRAGEAVLAAEGRGGRLEPRNKECTGAGAARAADRRNTRDRHGRTSGCPARAARSAPRAEETELSNNLFTQWPRGASSRTGPSFHVRDMLAAWAPPSLLAPPLALTPRPLVARPHPSSPRPLPRGPSGAERRGREGTSERSPAERTRTPGRSGPSGAKPPGPEDRAGPSAAGRSRAGPSGGERGGAPGQPP